MIAVVHDGIQAPPSASVPSTTSERMSSNPMKPRTVSRYGFFRSWGPYYRLDRRRRPGCGRQPPACRKVSVKPRATAMETDHSFSREASTCDKRAMIRSPWSGGMRPGDGGSRLLKRGPPSRGRRARYSQFRAPRVTCP
jgi:hypothetical protein